MFDRATRSEEELRLIRSIAGLVDTGVALRTEIIELSTVLAQQASVLWAQAGQCSLAITHCLADIEQSLAKSGRLKSEREQQKTTALEAKWEAGRQLTDLEQRKRALEDAHLRWGSYSAAMIKEMQEAAADLARGVVRREEHVRQAGTFDHNAMRSEVADLGRRIKDNRRFLDHFDRTMLAYLLKAGVDPSEVEKAFQVLHPDGLKLLVGDEVHIQSPEQLIENVHAISARVQEGIYQDGAVRVQVGGLAGPDLDTMRNRKHIAARLALDEHRLRESEERIRVAEELESTKVQLEKDKDELDQRRATLNAYAEYERGWAGREQLDAQLVTARLHVSQATERVQEMQADLQRLDEHLGVLHDEKAELQPSAGALRRQLDDYRAAAERLGLPLEASAEQAPIETRSLLEALGLVSEQMTQWLGRTKDIEKRRGKLKLVEEQIVKESAQSRAQRIYFDDPESVWSELAERREVIPDLETSVQKQWDDLFTLLTANFEQIIIGLRNVETAVRTLNRNVKSYQVSNLMAVELTVEKIRTTYNAIETLASKESLFQDADSIELAKRTLRDMIEGRQVIELENLFEIRIRVQENDGRWNDAKSLDDIGSTGTGITAKAMIFVQLVRAIVGNSDVALHFYLDETGQLDEENLKATTAMAVSRGMVPITAQPGVRMESLAHPKVTVYTLGTTAGGRFRIDSYQTYHAMRVDRKPKKPSHESNRAETVEKPA